jgi:hypothetical protein
MLQLVLAQPTALVRSRNILASTFFMKMRIHDPPEKYSLNHPSTTQQHIQLRIRPKHLAVAKAPVFRE